MPILYIKAGESHHYRFLQSPSSNLLLDKNEALLEHGIATVACLLAGGQRFLAPHSENVDYSAVVKGLHGFHIYATAHWHEYLIYHVGTLGGTHNQSSLLDLANRLSVMLDEHDISVINGLQAKDPAMRDKRLDALEAYPNLIKLVKRTLVSRSQKRLEAELFQDTSKIHVIDWRPILIRMLSRLVDRPTKDSNFRRCAIKHAELLPEGDKVPPTSKRLPWGNSL